MFILLCIVAIVQWFLFIYIPVVGFYGIIKMMMEPDVIKTLCSPFLGIKKVSLQRGLIIWMIQVVLFVEIMIQIGEWIAYDKNPLIRIW